MDYIAALTGQAEELLFSYRSALGGLTSDQLGWSPDAGKWSAGRIARHLVISHEGYHRQFRKKIPLALKRGLSARREFRSGPVGAWFNGRLLDESRRYKTLPSFNPGRDEVSAAVLDQFSSMQEEFISLMRDARDVDLARVRIYSPAMPLIRFRLGDAFRILLTHEERHLGQIRRLLAHEAFPR